MENLLLPSYSEMMADRNQLRRLYEIMDAHFKKTLSIVGVDTPHHRGGESITLHFNWVKYEDIQMYLQIEKGLFQYRIHTLNAEKGNRKAMRTKYSKRLLDHAKEKKIAIERPKRFGSGKTMTVAVVPVDDWYGTEIYPPLETVIKNMQKHFDFLNEFTSTNIPS